MALIQPKGKLKIRGKSPKFNKPSASRARVQNRPKPLKIVEETKMAVKRKPRKATTATKRPATKRPARKSMKTRIKTVYRNAKRKVSSGRRRLNSSKGQNVSLKSMLMGSVGAIGLNAVANLAVNKLMSDASPNAKLIAKLGVALLVPMYVSKKVKDATLRSALNSGALVLGAIAIKDFITPQLPASLQGDELTDSEKALLNAYAESMQGDDYAPAMLGAEQVLFGDAEEPMDLGYAPAMLGAEQVLFGDENEQYGF
jgi:hypothetical protein